jgi:7-cyano-7-deazaguanine reductase
VPIPEIEGRGVLGETGSTPSKELDTFIFPEKVKRVIYISDEVTSLCPITGAPDYYVVTISLVGSALGIESKSLKLYLQAFRDEGNFCEAFAAIIAQDVRETVGESLVEVKVVQKPRGGVSIEATAVAE